MVAHRQAPRAAGRWQRHRGRRQISRTEAGAMTTFARFATRQPTICAVCGRHAVWLGYRPPRQNRAPVIWLCDDEYCHAAGREVYFMRGPILDAHELGAMLEAGSNAAEYLEGLGTTD